MQGRGFRDLRKEYETAGIRIFGISFDTPEENRAFAEKYDFQYPLLSDDERVLARAFDAGTADDAYARRVGVILDAAGKVIHHFPQASARTFALDVLETLGLGGIGDE